MYNIILLVCSVIAAIGAIAILWPKRAKPEAAVKPELFIKKSEDNTAHCFCLRCTVRNGGSRLCCVEDIKIRFDGNFQYTKAGAVDIITSEENTTNISSTQLPVDIPPDGAQQFVVVGHFVGPKGYPAKANIEIVFSGKTKSLDILVPASEQNAIRKFGRVRD